jgi:hypothetical protein
VRPSRSMQRDRTDLSRIAKFSCHGLPSDAGKNDRVDPSIDTWLEGEMNNTTDSINACRGGVFRDALLDRWIDADRVISDAWWESPSSVIKSFIGTVQQNVYPAASTDKLYDDTRSLLGHEKFMKYPEIPDRFAEEIANTIISGMEKANISMTPFSLAPYISSMDDLVKKSSVNPVKFFPYMRKIHSTMYEYEHAFARIFDPVLKNGDDRAAGSIYDEWIDEFYKSKNAGIFEGMSEYFTQFRFKMNKPVFKKHAPASRKIACDITKKLIPIIEQFPHIINRRIIIESLYTAKKVFCDVT